VLVQELLAYLEATEVRLFFQLSHQRVAAVVDRLVMQETQGVQAVVVVAIPLHLAQAVLELLYKVGTAETVLLLGELHPLVAAVAALVLLALTGRLQQAELAAQELLLQLLDHQ
jgi:hypothetical protein